MQRVLSAKQMREADYYTISRLGVSEEILVQRAGQAVAEEITKRFLGGRVLVCVGKGNNGADGKVVAEGNSIDLDECVKKRTVKGGPSPECVLAEVKALREELNK